MGTVYKALSKTDNKWYAVKVLPRRSMWNVRLARRQVRQFEQFNHPSVVPFVDVGTSGGLHYLSWPLVEGEPLDHLIQREGKVAPEVAALFAMQTAAGLHACHQHGIFHGLLKPSNMMLAVDGQVRILDLGIGALLSENEGESLVDTMSTANTLTSGLDCASPESIMEPTNRTAAGDQYSLGCSLYFFLAGRYPFPEGSAVEKMMAHQYKQPTPIKELVPNLPDALAAIVEQLMQKKPEDRFASCEEVVDALRTFAAKAQGSANKPKAEVRVSAGPARSTDNGTPAAAPKKGSSSDTGTRPAPRGRAAADEGARGRPAADEGARGRGADQGSGGAGGRSSGGGGRAGTGGGSSSLRDELLGRRGGRGGGAAPAPAPPPKKELPPELEEEEEEEDVEDEGEEEEEEGAGDDNRVNTILVVVGGVILAGLVFWFALNFFRTP
jgi:serine/threonine-protein kinase